MEPTFYIFSFTRANLIIREEVLICRRELKSCQSIKSCLKSISNRHVDQTYIDEALGPEDLDHLLRESDHLATALPLTR